MNTSHTSQTRAEQTSGGSSCFALFRLLMLFAGLTLLPALQATVTLPFYDGFDYPEGTRLGAESPQVWDIGNSTGTASPTYQSAAALSYSGAPASTGIGVEMTGTPTSNRDRGVGTVTNAMTGSGETLYASFMLNVQTDPGAQRQIAYWDENNSAGTPSAGLFLNADRTLSLSKASTTPSATNATPLNPATTHFIVLAYKSLAGSDAVSLWIDPVLGGSEPAATLTTTTGSDRSALAGFFLSQKSGYTGTLYIDEVRLGTNWADVTPSSGTCDTAAVTSDPSNASVEVGEMANFAISAEGTSRTYQWQLSTDSGSNWNDTFGTGYDTASYTTDPTTTGNDGDQYRCIVNVACDSSSVTSLVATLFVTCNTAAITSEPSSTAVDAGQTANFSITATGSSPTLQWEYSPDSGTSWFAVFNGTGGTTASYTTEPTTTGENGYQYRCIVSVACDSSSATSQVATLTVSCETAGITSGPASSAVPEGLTATFSVTATGSSPSYQWEVSTDGGFGWSPVGGNNAFYTTPATTSGDNGNQYRCTVSVACDASSDISAVATLNVVGADASFRSAATGDWQDASTWELSGDNGATWFAAGVAPTAANSTNILIAAGTTVTLTADTTVDETVVAAGGTLTIASNKKIIVADGAGTDLSVFGTVNNISTSGSALTLQDNATVVIGSGGVLVEDGTSSGWISAGAGSSITFASGGKFQLVKTGGRIPLATWNAGSICEIAYTENGSKPDTAYLSQDFSHFTVNCPLNTSGWDFAGKLTNVQGDLTVTLGAFQGAVEFKLFSGSSNSGNLNVGGDLTMNTGRLNIASSGGPWTITLTGDLFIVDGASMDLSGSSSASYTMILNGSGTQNYTCNGVNTATKLNWTVNSGSTLNLNNDLPLTQGDRTLTVDGTVNLNGNTLSADLLAGSGTVRNQGGGNGLLVVGAGNGLNTVGTLPSLVDGTSGTLGLGQSGSGTLTITDAQTFSGGLVVSNGTALVNNVSGSGTGSGAVTVVDGTLGGNGTIAGSVTVEGAGNLAPGNSIEALTINGVLTLNGTFTSEVSTFSVPNTDQILGTTSVNYGGTLEIVNQGGALTASDTFQIFPAGTRSGGFSGILPANPDNNAGLAWDTSTLTTDGTLRIANVGGGPDTTPTNIVSSVSGGNLTLSWPSGHIGWTLQAQTNSNSIGLSNNWTTYGSGFTDTNEAVIPIAPNGPAVFFRLFYQVP